MISHHLSLDYALAPGWQRPFVEGLIAGKAVARQCTACRHTSFPPLRSCACGASDVAWTTLPGTAKIAHRTNGQDGSFALVQFDGADSQSVVRLEGITTGVLQGQIAMPPNDTPMLILGPLDPESAP